MSGALLVCGTHSDAVKRGTSSSGAKSYDKGLICWVK
jgi:hypothetical protein